MSHFCLIPHLDGSNAFVELVQRREVGILLAHNVALVEPREPSAEVVPDESGCRDSKNLDKRSVTFCVTSEGRQVLT
jgi:hypothetical protein